MIRNLNIKQFLPALCVALVAGIYVLPEKGAAQALSGDSNSTPIQMVVNSATNGELWRTSESGILEPVGLRAGEQLDITLILPGGMVGSPVNTAPLDGGEIVASPNLSVDNDRTAAFKFTGATTPGFYRVLVTIASEQYQLRIYVVPAQIDVNCPPAP
jgi:hypothetical protein